MNSQQKLEIIQDFIIECGGAVAFHKLNDLTLSLDDNGKAAILSECYQKTLPPYNFVSKYEEIKEDQIPQIFNEILLDNRSKIAEELRNKNCNHV